MSEDGKTNDSAAGAACRLVGREERIIRHKEVGRTVSRREWNVRRWHGATVVAMPIQNWKPAVSLLMIRFDKQFNPA
jgi:hypothetical protein